MNPDRRLVRRFLRRGEERAFRELYRRHTPVLYALCLRLLGGREADAQEAIQDVWVRACAGLPRFRWRSSLRTWLCGITVNRAREQFRHDRTEPAVIAAGELDGHRAPAPDGRIDRLDLERAIAGLPAGYRQVLVLRDIEGFTHREIGELLGIDPGTSKSQLHHARRAMRTLLSAGFPSRKA